MKLVDSVKWTGAIVRLTGCGFLWRDNAIIIVQSAR